ncbi:MAG: disulfide bond formation protein B [Candidatus Pacebacteria bacterium]|nr:disulfide bond formation protein B [Candidatus Paceibacterota bacterium]
MSDSVHYLNVFLGLGAILLQVASVLALGMLFFGPKKNIFLDFINKHFLVLGFIFTLFSALFSLVYSEIINFAPCMLCWYQRVAMFPMVILFGVAFWVKDRAVVRYVLPLACLGFLVSVYQNFFYYFGESSTLPCDASGVSCYQQLVSEFGGYISIPMLALTGFVAVLTLLAIAHFYNKENID